MSVDVAFQRHRKRSCGGSTGDHVRRSAAMRTRHCGTSWFTRTGIDDREQMRSRHLWRVGWDLEKMKSVRLSVRPGRSATTTARPVTHVICPTKKRLNIKRHSTTRATCCDAFDIFASCTAPVSVMIGATGPIARRVSARHRSRPCAIASAGLEALRRDLEKEVRLMSGGRSG